ncbi:hypothetical protein [Geomesophilobacter sediminis]|uniref:Uncharacterized protein n=1 Tax=Geomesophilobacter sediminis TaxID=2798584 RepID=A0A8J7JKD3_9BACT|nr:hypothetical protein [Geomesophilobacter sediminis]MBJ6723800.1 hypothetical protein [Geomesophilobacter sediminis]
MKKIVMSLFAWSLALVVIVSLAGIVSAEETAPSTEAPVVAPEGQCPTCPETPAPAPPEAPAPAPVESSS